MLSSSMILFYIKYSITSRQKFYSRQIFYYFKTGQQKPMFFQYHPVYPDDIFHNSILFWIKYSFTSRQNSRSHWFFLPEFETLRSQIIFLHTPCKESVLLLDSVKLLFETNNLLKKNTGRFETNIFSSCQICFASALLNYQITINYNHSDEIPMIPLLYYDSFRRVHEKPKIFKLQSPLCQESEVFVSCVPEFALICIEIRIPFMLSWSFQGKN